MKKKLLVLLAIVFTLTLSLYLTACGVKPTGKPNTTTPNGTENGTIEVNVKPKYGFGTDKEKYSNVI